MKNELLGDTYASVTRTGYVDTAVQLLSWV